MKRFITIQQSDGSKLHLTEADMPLVAGSGDDVHIRFPDGPSKAAYIGDAQGHLFIQPFQGLDAPLFHNDRHLTESAWLKSGDQIRSGHAVVHYELRGDRLQFTVTEAESGLSEKMLSPPREPPAGNDPTGDDSRHLPVRIDDKTVPSTAKKIAAIITGFSFLLIGFAALFVLMARPLMIDISPEPDVVTISGFPLCFKVGSRYLCLPGSYTTTVQKEGYQPFSGTVTVDKSAENRFSVVLEKLPGILSLSVTPASEVAVYSDDQLIGTTPPNTMEISPGHHTLKIIKERYQPFLTEITIAGEGKTQKIDAQLQPDWAIISFSSVPTGATVFIDDKQVGQTPLSLELLSGGHKVSLTKELFSGLSLDIVVTAGKPEAHRIKMQSLPARLMLSSKPAQAAVSIDKEYKGITPLTISLSSQTEHEIVLSAPGHKSTSRVLTLKPGEEQKISLTLKQEHGTIYLTTNPPDASITINGKHYSSTQRKLSLPSQSHTVVVKAPGYKPVTRTILPRIGFSQQISIDLTPETGTVGSRSTSAGTGSPGGSIKTAGGQELLYVQPAPFTMGASRRQPGRRANERERGVIMKRSFYLSDKPVTNHQYREFNRQHSGGAVGGYTLEGDQQPVVKISWEDAVSYLNWLSLKENLQPFYIKNGKTYIPALPLTNGYRLPTEAEWAFSARKLNSPKNMRFPWNGVFPPRTVTGNYADESARTFLPTIINGYRDAFPVSSPVGSFPPNPGGFFDMGGNIGEWCHDYYSANTSSLQSQPDPLGPSSGTHRVIRGSSWRDASITELRLSYRAYHRESRDNVGFRVARYP